MTTGNELEGLRAQLQAATERAETYEESKRTFEHALAQMTERAERLEASLGASLAFQGQAVQERDAAIKAKEEAEAHEREAGEKLLHSELRADAERKQVEFLNERISQLLDTAKREGMLLERDGFGRNDRAERAQATAESLRAALEGIRNHSLTIENADFRAREALAAHSKAVGT